MVTECIGETYRGYKGGDFYMDENTPIWIANWGDGGVRIMDINIKTGKIISAKEDDD